MENPLGALLISLGIWVVIISLYFVPCVIAFRRKHTNRISILIINFFLGWTIAGWVVALAWSLQTDRDQATTNHLN